MLLIVLDQSDRVVCHESADGTAGLDEQNDGPIWPEYEPRGIEVQRLLVDVAPDGCRGLSSVEAAKDRIRKLMAIHHFGGVRLRVHRKGDHLGVNGFESLNCSLKVS